MFDDLRQVQRYELKYLVAEETAQRVRDHILHFCSLDKYADPVTRTYMVNNLYFDTPGLQFYHDTRFRKPTRFKPRARYYGEYPDFIYPELKYRTNSIIWKTRTRVAASEWTGLFYPDVSDCGEAVIKSRIDTFQEAIDLYHAEPVLQVRYEREPYVTDLENYGRVTFDRKISSRPANGSLELDLAADYIFYDDAQTIRGSDSMVVLEIKVETNVPAWVIDVVSRFNLMQTGFSKYCNGIECHMGYRAGVCRGHTRHIR